MLVDKLKVLYDMKPSSRFELSRVMYKSEVIYRMYINLCYRTEEVSKCFNDIKYNVSDNPLGFDYGSLESSFSIVRDIIEHTEMTDTHRVRRLTQTLENVNSLEAGFILEVIHKEHTGMTESDFLSLEMD